MKLVPFEAVEHVLQDPEIHSLAQSAYLECAISTHIGEKEIGCSTEDIWHCFVRELILIVNLLIRDGNIWKSTRIPKYH